MPQHQLTPPSHNYPDPRRSGLTPDSESHESTGVILFTANAGGTTTTLVGAAATLATGANVVRVGELFRLFAAAASKAPKQETVFRVTSVADAAGTTTVTFTPAAAAATANGNQARQVAGSANDSLAALDRRLISSGVYTQAMVDAMSMNDKVYAVRVLDNPDSL